MKITYIPSQSAVKPELIDSESSKKYVYLRKDIVETKNINEDTDESTIIYEYKEAKLTKEEYEKYSKEIQLTNIEALKEQMEMLTDCILEMSESIYA